MFNFYCDTPTPNTGRKPVSEDKLEQVKRERAFHITPLAVSELAPENWENVRYKGDWWFDVDEPNLGDAIVSLHGLMDALEKLDVNLEHLRYFASGSKGFHVRVPASLFDGDKEQKHLPEIYEQMALRLIFDHQVKGLDTNLYNGKTGHLLRVENKPRPDGKFKVPITLDEARTLTVEQYAELTRQPREINHWEPPEGTRAEGLCRLFAECRITAESLASQQPGHTHHDVSLLKGHLPKCIRWITTHENIKPSKGWNDVAMQLAAWVSVSERDEDVIEQATRNHRGDSGRSPDELKRAVYAVLKTKSLEFKCAAMNALFEQSPCGGCPLNRPTEAPNWQALEDAKPANDAIGPDHAWPRAEWRPVVTTEAGDSDLGNVQRLFDHAGRDLLFVADVGWHIWNGNRWQADEAATRRLADELPRIVLRDARDCLDRATKETDPDRRDKLTNKAERLTRWSRKCESGKVVEAAFSMLERRLVVAPSEVDNDPFLFSVNNGTIELKTGTLRPSERGDFVTKGTSIYYDPDAKCPTFEAFLNRIFRQHLEVIPFLQRAVGYTLTGSTAEQVMLILHGTGSNGKSTLLNVISDILGDLAKVADSSLLTVNQHEQHPTGLAGLKAARFVSASETGQGCRLNESLIKWLTGGDVITARLMRKDFFTFTPQFKIWLGTNHKPTVRGQDHGVWRRLLLIPFDERIEGAERDPSLPQKLKAEFPGILNWALEGCRMWLADGLQPPVVVTNQTEIYKLEQDVFGRFLLETFDLLDGAVTPASECYRRYADWCGHNREFCLNNTQFGLTLAERGFRKTRQSRGMAYLGLRPKPAESVSQRENSPPYDD